MSIFAVTLFEVNENIMKLHEIIPFDKYDINDNWGTNHRIFVPKVIAEVKAGKLPNEWAEGLFHDFIENYHEQSVATIRQGGFTLETQKLLREHWVDSGIRDILKQIADAPNKYLWDLYDQLDDIIRRYTNKHYEAATARMIVTLQPCIFSTVVTSSSIDNIVGYMRSHNVEGFDYNNYGGNLLQKNRMLQKFLFEEYPQQQPLYMATVAWRIPELLDEIDQKMEDINKYKKLLLQKKQIILQGAPGTGKTYSTAQLALSIIGVNDIDLTNHEKVMEKYNQLHDEGQIEFVTFHMSMDYEDFVEGIKPETEGNNITYNVENGIFKKICRDASACTSSNFETAYEHFLKDIAEYNDSEPFTLKTINEKEFGVCPNTKGNLSLLTGPNRQKNGVLRKSSIEETAKGNVNADWYYYNLGVVAHLKRH